MTKKFHRKLPSRKCADFSIRKTIRNGARIKDGFWDDTPAILGFDLDELISDRIARGCGLYGVKIYTVETEEALPAEVLNWAENERTCGEKKAF
ncbi:MAG: hypothetical protein IPK65_01225 [Gammaproteobacteria bacterium]|nr:hypothetical protein [Gammaproteobacteria bacterium]